MRITVNEFGPRLKMFIPCLEGRCPEKMRLIDYTTEHPKYKCPREDCCFHRNPYLAFDLRPSLAWVRDGTKEYPKKKDGDKLTPKDMETMV